MAELSYREAYTWFFSIFLLSVVCILLISNKSTLHQVNQPKDKQTEMTEKLWRGKELCTAGQGLLWKECNTEVTGSEENFWKQDSSVCWNQWSEKPDTIV